MPRQIEVWAVSNLTFVLLSVTTLLLSMTEVTVKGLTLKSLRSGTLNVVTATQRMMYVGCAKMCMKLYMSLQTIHVTRNNCTQRNATQ